jgi:hypothetical protein
MRKHRQGMMEISWVKKGPDWYRGAWRVGRLSERDVGGHRWALYRMESGEWKRLQTAFTARWLMGVADTADSVSD